MFGSEITDKTISGFKDEKTKVEVRKLNAWYGKNHVLKDVTLSIKENKVTAVIGPSGCGKSTLLRCINRLHELIPGSRVAGSVLLDGLDVYEKNVDPVSIRRRIGMVFQKPNPFPNMSIKENVAAGLKLAGVRDKRKIDEIVRNSLENVFLWEEVADRLDDPAPTLSGGQQQRLCIARAIAVQPEVILMDEPCSSLDPVATAKIEELIVSLKKNYTILVVTHNLQQAARIADYTAFLYLGRLIEYGETERIFEEPKDELTKRYIAGRFG